MHIVHVWPRGAPQSTHTARSTRVSAHGTCVRTIWIPFLLVSKSGHRRLKSGHCRRESTWVTRPPCFPWPLPPVWLRGELDHHVCGSHRSSSWLCCIASPSHHMQRPSRRTPVSCTAHRSPGEPQARMKSSQPARPDDLGKQRILGRGGGGLHHRRGIHHSWTKAVFACGETKQELERRPRASWVCRVPSPTCSSAQKIMCATSPFKERIGEGGEMAAYNKEEERTHLPDAGPDASPPSSLVVVVALDLAPPPWLHVFLSLSLAFWFRPKGGAVAGN